MKPFDLEAAKRGDPIVTRDGREAKFIAHVPEAKPPYRVVILIDGKIFFILDSGHYWEGTKDSKNDIFMAQKKRTVWVNLYADGWRQGYHYDTQLEADVGSQGKNRIGGKAYPVEIEE